MANPHLEIDLPIGDEPNIPRGYRTLKVGEFILDDDQYLSTTGKWTEAGDSLCGLCVIDNNVTWIRKLS